MSKDHVVRDRDKGLTFHIDGNVMGMSDTHNYLLACGFSQRESAEFMRKLVDQG